MENRSRKIPFIPGLILRIIYNCSLKEAYMGDIEEEYRFLFQTEGRFRSLIWAWKEAVKSIPKGIKELFRSNFSMFKNNLKIAFRNIERQKGYSFINIAGLSLGLACSILIILWILYELNFDRFHKNYENIYRITSEYKSGDRILGSTIVPMPLGKTAVEMFPEVTASTRFRNWGKIWRIQCNDKTDDNNDIALTDNSFFEIFTFQFIKGDPENALTDKYSVVITRKTAEKYFGDEDPIGKTVFFTDEKIPLKVTAVIENIPPNSHIQFDMAINSRIQEIWDWNFDKWNTNTSHTFGMYILVTENFDKNLLEAKISGLVKQNNVDYLKKNHLQPLRDIHLRSRLDIDTSNHGKVDIKDIYMFLLIAISVLLIACINFMSLSTARSAKRAKEVGIRKVSGAFKKDLVKQFLGESILYAFVSLFLALILVKFLLPILNKLTEKEIDILLLNHGYFFLTILIITLVTGLFSGSYTAFFLSSFQPVKILKRMYTFTNTSRFSLRRFLVTVQYIFTIILLIGTIVISSQLSFINNKDLGYNRKNVVSFYINNTTGKMETIRNELLRHPGIENVTSGFIPVFRDMGHRTKKIDWDGKNPGQEMEFNWIPVYYDYAETYKIQMVQGRFFSREFPADTSNFVLTESAVKEMKLKDPLGKRFTLWDIQGKIIGIAKDFHFSSLRVKVLPCVFRFTEGFEFAVKIRPENQKETIQYIGQVFKKFNPDRIFKYDFLEDDIKKLYRKENKIGSIVKYFTFLALIVFCLGLFGLISFIAEQRTREIGVRKILGATVTSIVRLLSKEFLILLILASIIAWPIGYYIMNKWLQNFAYKINFEWWIFALAGFSIFVFSFITVSCQTIKAARKNPADTLRYE